MLATARAWGTAGKGLRQPGAVKGEAVLRDLGPGRQGSNHRRPHSPLQGGDLQRAILHIGTLVKSSGVEQFNRVVSYYSSFQTC